MLLFKELSGSVGGKGPRAGLCPERCDGEIHHSGHGVGKFLPGVDSSDSEGKLRNRLSFEKVDERCGLKLLSNVERAGFSHLLKVR